MDMTEEINRYFNKRSNAWAGNCEVIGCGDVAEYDIKPKYYSYVMFKHYCKIHASQIAEKIAEKIARGE